MKRLSLAMCLFYLIMSGLATTVVNGQQDYFTEHFSSDTDRFDLSNKAIMFTPAADGNSYTACLQEIAQLPTDPAGGDYLDLDDDDYEFVSLNNQKTVSIFGNSFDGFYVGSNGYITFTEGDEGPVESFSNHFTTMRISALFNDLDPSEGGVINWKQFADRVVVTWRYVPQYSVGGSNTFQVEIYFDGRIRLAWRGVTTAEGIVGLSNGLGLPADFQETDLSAYPLCGPPIPMPSIISGYVRTSNVSGIGDVLLTFSNGGGSATTNSSGYYSNTVEYGWSGLVIPSKSGYTFNPPSKSYSNVTSGISGQNYTGSTGWQPGFFTERFSSGTDRFDLSNKAIMFTPIAGGTSYNICLQEVIDLPTGGTQLALADDGYEFVSLDDQKTVSIYGSSFPSFYVGSNGYITFTEGDTQYSGSLLDHFARNRISALFTDLNPSAGGVVRWKQLEDRVAVTWQNIPEYGAGGSNTFQVEMYFDGRIRLAWRDVTAYLGTVGLSEGNGLWQDFQETDLSAYPLCGGGSPMAPTISGYVRTPSGSGISDVLLTFSDDGGSVTTDNNGYYSNMVWYGWSGVVAPNKGGYIFDPRTISYTNVTSDISEQNYAGLEGLYDYFAEQFSTGTNAFDLANHAIVFTPTADHTSYSACVQKITSLPTDPIGSLSLGLDDDDYQLVHLSNQKTVSIFGSSFSSFYVGSNGYITFTRGDEVNQESFSEHFATKRISVLFNDFDPTTAPSEDAVSWKQLSDRVVVTWKNVPEFFRVNLSTFQVEMYFDGRIRLVWLYIEARSGIVGLSDGLGLPSDFQQTDLSMYPICGGGPPIPIPPVISGYVRTPEGSGISNVLLTFSNDGGSSTTDSNGYYSNTVWYDWSGVVTPSKLSYTFNPPSMSYSTVTSDIPDQNYTGVMGVAPGYFTEEFSSDADPFDLSNKAIMFIPTADGTSYNASVQAITYLPTDPVEGTQLTLDDDDFAFVSLTGQKTVSIYGSSFPSFFVGSNGYITFTEGDVDYRALLAFHFATMRISALFTDLNPSAAGVVSWKQLADRVAVTWQGVPGYGTTNSNTFQVEMYYNGRIRLAWLAVAARTGIVGLSEGLGLPADFDETDFSQGQPDGEPPVDESPIAYWTMDDNAANTTVVDSSGRGNHGTAQRNTSSLTAAGIIDGALTFNGSSDYVDCGSSTTLQGRQALTVSTWINGSSYAKAMNMIVCGDKKNLDFCWGLRIDNSVANFFIRAGNYYAATGPTLSANQWYHIVGVWNRTGGANNLRIYVDGSLAGTATVNADMDANTVYVTIGRLYYPTINQYFNGLIDDVRIYNRVLSETEITALYNQAAGP